MIKTVHLIGWQRLLLTALFAGCFLLPGGDAGHTLTRPSQASAIAPAHYYVSTNGSDAGDGSAAHPWATLSHADEVVAPGDTVLLADGVYRGDVVLQRSGTKGHPITFAAQHQWKAKLVGTSSGDGSAVIRVTGGRIIVKDFDISGKDANGIILAYSGTSASYNQAIGNYVHDMTTPCTDNSGTAIETGGGDDYRGISHNDIIGNLVVNITPYGGCPDGHPASGLYAQIPYSVIANNIVINAGYGIQSWHAASHVTVVGNTLINNLRSITIGDGDSPGGRVNDYSLVQNNLIYNSKDTAIAETGKTGPHNRYLTNLIYGGDTSISLNHSLHASGTVYANPRFIHNTGTAFGNYRLSFDSGARGTGLALTVVGTDFTGTLRPHAGPTDVGACLYQPVPAPPCPEPQMLKVAAGASAVPAQIKKGQSSTITWTTEDATAATLNGAQVPLNGSMKVHPTVTTTYKVIATSPAGQTDWGSATVVVR
jgi:chondroitinase B-like protein